ncbi:MAG TPA: hypothetical protein VF774_00430 [Pseudoduganella sp.]|jgi:hypothetical protein
MLTELPGLVLSRTIPSDCLMGIATGAYKIYGGVIRDSSGQIVAHLVNNSASLLGASPLSALVEAVNTVQLYKIGQSVANLETATAQLINLAQGTAILSGLTLAVSVGGFGLLLSRLTRLEKKLGELAKDVKAIHSFLQSQERAALNNALQTLSVLTREQDEKIRIPLLVNARQAIGTIHQRYRDQLRGANAIEEVLAIEEYFSTTALSHALCTAELGMQSAAATELNGAHLFWREEVRRISKTLILCDPQRFLTSAHKNVKTEELVDWLDFAHDSQHGIGWIDVLREQSSSFRLPKFGTDTTGDMAIDLIRKFHARDKVFAGYTAQYQYLAKHGIFPSEHQQYVERLGRSGTVNGCHVLLSREYRLKSA